MLNKKEFVNVVSELGGITKKEAEVTLELVLAALQKACKENGGVNLAGIGKAEVKDTKASSGVITKKDGTKQEWEKPAGQTVKVKLSDKFISEIVGE